MKLCTMKELIDRAHKEHYAVPAFNICNLETIQGILEKAEENESSCHSAGTLA